MKITITGLGGTGKSTVGKLLAEQLRFAFTSGGDMFREMAADRGMTIYEFDEFAKSHPEVDKELDQRQKDYGASHDNFVLESRLGWLMVPDSVKIKLSGDFAERMRRIVERDGGDIAVVSARNREREKSYERYVPLYKIDNFLSDEHFDMVINTSAIPPAAIVKSILDHLEERGYNRSE